jgi:thiamine biosynthesis lipoprotein
MARPLGLIAVAVLGTGLGSLEAQVGRYLTKAESVASAFPEAVKAREWARLLSREETATLDKKLRRRIPDGGYYVYLAEDGEGPIGIGVLTAEVGKTQNFYFLVALDMQRRVRGIEVLKYQETHGGEIRRRRFLNQFLGRGQDKKFRLMREIENISGSTLSAQAVVRGVRKAQAVVELWFGGMSDAEISRRFETEGEHELLELPSHPPGLHRYTFPAMGTVASLVLYKVADAKAKALRELVREEIRRVERMVSIWSEDSEIRQVQERAHLEPVKLTAELYGILERALDAGRSSTGAFDPSIAPALDLLKQGLLSEEERQRLAELVGWQKVQLDPKARTLRLPVEGMALTTDAFAKGYVVDRVADLLRRQGVRRARVGFRSTYFLLGGPHKVPLADGRVLTLTDRAVSTSGPGDRPGHIIDPRTLEPAEFGGQVVVVSPQAFDADWLSTAALVLGPQPCLEVLNHEERAFHFFSAPARPR